MPSTENAILERIQREINEEAQRERELKRLHSEQLARYANSTCSEDSRNGSINGDISQDDDKPGPMQKSQSTSALLNGDHYKNDFENGALSNGKLGNGTLGSQNGIKINGIRLNGIQAKQNGTELKQNGIESKQNKADPKLTNGIETNGIQANGSLKQSNGTLKQSGGLANPTEIPNGTIKSNGSIKSNGIPNTTHSNGTNGTLTRNHIFSSQTNLSTTMSNNKFNAPIRLFQPNQQTKGVMHRFFKSRGKINAVAALNNNNEELVTPPKQNIPNKRHSWNIPEFIEPTKVTIDASKCIRRGFVPIEERMKKEFQEMHIREVELKKDRRKSQEFLSMDDEDFDDYELIENPIKATRSMTQLYVQHDFTDDEEINSAPSSLKPAKSLAELCDVEDEANLQTPSSLISKFEEIIKKNKQTRT